MRYLILSDIHANIDALDAVLAAAPKDGWDRALVLGDLVGYGAEPGAVIDRVRSLDPLATIRGNHDKAACGIEDGSSFNYVARLAAQWTFEALSPEHREYLRALPQGPLTIDGTIEICHGAPFDEDHYIFDAEDASRALDSAARPVCLFGHTHLPVVFRRNPHVFDGFMPEGPNDSLVEIESGLNYLDQCRIGRAAARRGSARGVWHLRLERTVAVLAPGRVPGPSRAAPDTECRASREPCEQAGDWTVILAIRGSRLAARGSRSRGFGDSGFEDSGFRIQDSGFRISD